MSENMRLFPPFKKKKKELQEKFRPILEKFNNINPNKKRIFVYYSPKRHRYYKIYLIFILCLMPLVSLANLYPNDALTISSQLTGNKTNEIILTKPSNSYTILSFNVLSNMNDLGGRILISCGTTPLIDIGRLSVNSDITRYPNVVCSENVSTTISGLNSTDRTGIRIVYLTYDLTSATSSGGGVSSTTQGFYNGFSYGEIIISLFVFWIFLMLIFNFMVAKFIGFYNKK